LANAKPVVYLLHGNDELAMKKFVDNMYARLGDPTTADLNFTRLDGRSASDNDLRSATGSIPFLADRRIVVLEHPTAGEPDKRKKSEYERYVEKKKAILNSLPETTALVLLVEDHIERRKWVTLPDGHWLLEWAHQAGEKALIKPCVQPGIGEMPRWIRKTAEEQKGQFTPQAAAALADLVGSDTRIAGQEITKLLTYVNFSRPVEQDDVAELVERIDQPDIFALVDALGARDGPKALRLLYVLLDEQDPLALSGMIIRQFRLLLLAREVMDRGGNPGQISEQLGGEPFRVTPFVASKLDEQARAFKIADLEQIYHQLLDLDETFKSSRMEPVTALVTFIADLTET
jgi:DNA polymerase III subunit delta